MLYGGGLTRLQHCGWYQVQTPQGRSEPHKSESGQCDWHDRGGEVRANMDLTATLKITIPTHSEMGDTGWLEPENNAILFSGRFTLAALFSIDCRRKMQMKENWINATAKKMWVMSIWTRAGRWLEWVEDAICSEGRAHRICSWILCRCEKARGAE